jgi:flagellar biosynthetic protein FliO
MRAHRLLILVMLVLLASPVLAVRRSSSEEYLVKPNDTAYAISQKYGISVDELARLNPSVNLTSLRAGETVKVSGTSKTDEAEPEKTTESRRSRRAEVTVQPETTARRSDAKDESHASDAVADKDTDSSAKPAAAEPKEPAKKPAAKPASKAKQGGYLSDYYNEPAKPAKDREPSVAASFIRVVGALVFVVALAVLSLYALKHFTSTKSLRKSPRRSINVIETTGLGPNRALHVVQAGGKFFLIGSTPTQVNLVAELTASEAQEAEPEDFATILHRSSSDGDRAETASKLSDALKEGASFLQKKTSATRSMRAKAEVDEN